MRPLILFFFLIFAVSTAVAQDIDVVYDKKKDFSSYKTFQMGEGEVITPSDRRQVDAVSLKKMVHDATVRELTEKGLTQIDSVGDLLVSYLIGSQERSDYSQLGPLGTSPTDNSRTWSRDYQMGSLVIDLNDRNKNLVWRVNATTTSSGTDINRMITQVVSAGFRKFSLKPKKVKKKK